MNNKEIDAAARGCKKYLNKVRIKSFASLKELNYSIEDMEKYIHVEKNIKLNEINL